MGFFERYLSIWVALCIVGGIGLGKVLGNSITVLSEMNIDNQFNGLNIFSDFS